MLKAIKKIFKSDPGFERQTQEINSLETEIEKLSDKELKEESKRLKKEAEVEPPVIGSTSLLPSAFALVREAAKRTLYQRHFDVQLMGGIVLHRGQIAEMRTGEGKTLAATLPVYLNALAGKGVHVVTVNEYLAKRDTVWMGRVYHALGLSVACLIHEGALIYDPTHTTDAGAEHETESFLIHGEYLRPISRGEAYQADITYGTNHEFGFDYLRDNLAYKHEDKVQREHNFAIIDEVDSILIDEARTPLIIAAPDTESSEFYKTFARLAANLKKDEDYTVDEKLRSVFILESGIDQVEQALNIKNLYAPENLRLSHYLEESLKAKELYLKDRDYVVKDGEIIIVDQFTGRLMLGRRYSGGLHQAIEAKEGVMVQQESRTYASISIQNYFRLYRKLAGMTGTAQTSAEEFHKVYGLEVVTLPTHKPMIRSDLPDLIYKSEEAKYNAIIEDVKERHKKGQPVLIGTVSIEKNEELARYLSRAGLRHEVLNAKNNEREGAIIAQTGRPGGITVATNMAGRGVDIILGGNPPSAEVNKKVIEAGGLHVIGTERHESRRIDNQLRGRSGRQGDPGSSQFFLSLEDDLMRIFGGERISGLMRTLKVPDDMPITAGLVSHAISQAQAKVEGMNFDARKHLLEYDDVLNKQRLAIYRKRDNLLSTGVVSYRHPKPLASHSESFASHSERSEESQKDSSAAPQGDLSISESGRSYALQMLDFLWMNHLENMEALQESVRLRAYGQHDPLVEYRKEGHQLFQQLLYDFETWVKENKEKMEESRKDADGTQTNVEVPRHSALSQRNSSPNFAKGKIGRNEPCPCGSGKKYKKCHGA